MLILPELIFLSGEGDLMFGGSSALCVYIAVMLVSGLVIVKVGGAQIVIDLFRNISCLTKGDSRSSSSLLVSTIYYVPRPTDLI